ncbi:MAG: methylenetetrahydrofolate reductase [Desulfurococcales archaeon]|nr:methylenetetrahydrofolate reductase [Desulfurococcales archaeon]
MSKNIEIFPELEPARSKEIILERLGRLAKLYKRIDVPDVPLGKPSISSPLLALYALSELGAYPIMHLRVRDHSIVSLKSIIKTAVYLGLRDQLYLTGDPPLQGNYCPGAWVPEDAVSYGNSYGVNTGLLLSSRRSIEEIRKRIDADAKYYYITRLNPENLSIVKEIMRLIDRRESEAMLGAYIVLANEHNKKYLEEHDIPYIPVEDIVSFLEKIEAQGVIERVILSSPGNSDLLTRSAYILKEVGYLK